MDGKYICVNTYENEREEYGTDFLASRVYDYKNGYMHSTENGTCVEIGESELKRFWIKVE